MTTWVALLRGVNVGRSNRLAMADLRRSIEDAGLAGVATHVQSGNVVFRGDGDEPAITALLRAVLAERHDLSVPVVVRPGCAIAGLVERHPFLDVAEPKLLHVAFLDREPDLTAGPEADRWLPDRWAVEGRELFLAFPGGSGRSKMTIEQFERPWG